MASEISKGVQDEVITFYNQFRNKSVDIKPALLLIFLPKPPILNQYTITFCYTTDGDGKHLSSDI